MHSNRSRGTLMSCTDHSAQLRFKSNTRVGDGAGGWVCAARACPSDLCGAKPELRVTTYTTLHGTDL